ncbi:hypothetical protein ACVWXP_001484 [Bradyrhizobium sp. USDA 4463]
MARTASGVLIARSISSCGEKHPEGDEDAGGEEGDQLDDGLGRDREHQAVLMLGRVGLPRAEQHREGRHRQRHHQRHVAEDRDVGERLVLAQDDFERGGHRLELERDVGHRADDGDQRYGRRHGLALAVTRTDEVRDRGDVVGFGKLDHAAEHAGAEPDHQNRTDIDREEVGRGAGGKAHRAEEGPGRAVDRQGQRVDHPGRAAGPGLRAAITVARHQEQEPDIAEGGCDHAPVVQHGERASPWAQRRPISFSLQI